MKYLLVFWVLLSFHASGRSPSSLTCSALCPLTPPPPLRPDAPVAELHDLFCKKLQQCCVMFDFLDCVADLKGKEIKRAALNELVESVATSRGVLIEPLYPEAIKMVRGVEKKRRCGGRVTSEVPEDVQVGRGRGMGGVRPSERRAERAK